jgi:hypothetical protein
LSDQFHDTSGDGRGVLDVAVFGQEPNAEVSLVSLAKKHVEGEPELVLVGSLPEKSFFDTDGNVSMN